MKKLLLLFSLMAVSLTFAQVTASDATLTICEINTDGFATFNLTQADSDVLNGQSASNFQVSYHTTNQDAQTAVNPIQPTYIGADGEMLYARVEDLGNGNFATSLLFLNVKEKPVANQIPPVEKCGDGTGVATFDLTQIKSTILGSQNPADFEVSFHSSQADADNGSPDLPLSYVTSTTTIYARAEELVSGCYSTTSFSLIVLDGVIANPAQDIVVCGNQGFGMFDLTFNESIVLGNQNPSMFDVSFYLSQSDADAETNEIVNSSAFSNTNDPQTIYVRVTNVNSSCNAITSFNISTVDCTQNADSDLVSNGDEDINNNGNLNDDDTDGNNVPNYLDDDDDGDGVLTADEDYNGNGDPTDDDTNSNSVPDYLEDSVALSTGNFEAIDFSVYPNPASEIITIQLNTTEVEKMQLFNMNGKLLKEFPIQNATRKQEISISEFSTGVYFLKISTKTESVIKKISIK